MVSNKVLVKADVTQFQTVGQGSPSAMDLFNAVRGRGTKPGSKVSRTGRLVGLAGLAGKGAALGATALSTADAMQGGNIAAPLGAGYTYQGLDPTGAFTARQIEGNSHVGVKPNSIPLPAPGMAANEGGVPLPSSTGLVNVSTSPSVPAPVASTPAAPIPALPQPAATAAPAVQLPPNVLNQQDMASTVEQQMNPSLPPNVLNQSNMASTVQQQMNPSGMAQYQASIDPVTGQPRPVLMPTKAFNGMLFDLLGPDNLYKMTPNEIGELAAFMYIKTR